MNNQNGVYHLLGSRVEMLSTNGGYKASIDPVLLAASVPVKVGQRVLDVGCGTGAAALCLVTRVPGIHAVGVDFQLPLIILADKIANLNGLESSTQFIACDFMRPAEHLSLRCFDHVMANPPHLKKGSGTLSHDPLKAAANVEGSAKLEDWVSFCFNSVINRGTVTFIHRFDRKDELISLVKDYGLVKVTPLWPKIRGIGAKRVLVQIIKGSNLIVSYNGGIVLHTDENEYTSRATAILRDMEAFNA